MGNAVRKMLDKVWGTREMRVRLCKPTLTEQDQLQDCCKANLRLLCFTGGHAWAGCSWQNDHLVRTAPLKSSSICCYLRCLTVRACRYKLHIGKRPSDRHKVWKDCRECQPQVLNHLCLQVMCCRPSPQSVCGCCAAFQTASASQAAQRPTAGGDWQASTWRKSSTRMSCSLSGTWEARRSSDRFGGTTSTTPTALFTSWTARIESE